VLAIGIVVDDAIVVIENVERIMAQARVTPREATNRAMRQISGALVAIVLVLCAVFVPVAFVPGITGAMYKQFAVTIVISVVLSGVVALTLTPALCAMLLRHEPGGARHGRLFTWFNARFAWLTGRYADAAGRVIGRPRLWVGAFGVMLALIAVLYRQVPSGFLPSEDKGRFALSIQLPDAASLQRTVATVERVERVLAAEPGVADVVGIAGLDLLTRSNQTNSATLFVSLKPWDERAGDDQSVAAILGRVNGKLAAMKEAVAFGFNLPEIPGLGTTSGLEMNLQQRSGGDIRQFSESVRGFVEDANATAVQGANGAVRTDVPQLYVTVDEDAARARGVGTGQIFATLQTMLSTLYINDFNLYDRPYRVQAEAQQQFRQRPDDIGRFYVRSTLGEMVPLSALVRSEMRGAPSLLTRFNGFPSATITGAPKAGQSSGEMLDRVEALVADKYAAQGVGFQYSGESYQERQSSGQSGVVLALGLVLVFLVLAAQYESWSVPFAVLLGIPFGLLGALVAAWLRGMPNDVFFQVGLFTVVGLAAKNAILIVEFATELRARGHSVRDAAIEAARERFRPILMTSFAFILGVAPLVLAAGAGAGSRRSLGTGVFFGMLAATLVGVFFIPLFFAVIRGLVERRGERGPRADSAHV
jgi:hydrophobe/amphiphile efflux-1 (HAE1) family protein